jgi:O-antigen ligase
MSLIKQQKFLNILNFLSFYGLLLIPLAYIFSAASINVIISLIVINLIVSSFINKNFLIFNNNFFKVTLIFYIYIFMQSFFFDHANILKSFFFLRFLLLPFGIYYLLNNNLNKIHLIKYFYLLIFFFVAADVFIQFFTGKSLLGYRADLINRIEGFPFEKWKTHTLQRFSGPFGYDKKAGSFLLFFGIIGYFLNNNILKNKNYFFLIFFLFILTISITITGDRAPVIILIFTIFLFFFLEKELRLKSLLALFIILIFFSITLLFSKNTKYRFIDNILEYSIISNSSLYNSNNINNEIKINESVKKLIIDNPWAAHYLTAIEIFKDTPIFGKGIRSFRYECEKYTGIQSSYAHVRCSTHPHNLLLEILIEVGIVGFFFFTLILYQFLKTKRTSYSNNVILYLFVATIIPIKPTGAFFSTWFGSILWLLIGFYYWEIKKKIIKNELK